MAFGLFILYACSLNNPSQLKFRKMLVEYAENPINIDELHPRFSWIITSEKRNQRQTAYQIMVASSPGKLKNNRADLWDSGRYLFTMSQDKK